MTDKQIIKLKPREDLSEKIIKEKGNTKCIFYSDDICRKGDKTRDCVNCARVEYNSLYSLNWDNQERLEKIIKQKEQECEKLKKQVEIFTRQLEKANREVIKEKEKNATQRQENEKLKQILTDIEFWVREFLKRTGQVVPNEIRQILQKISESEETNAR